VTAAEVAVALGLRELPEEGGLFAETLADGYSTAIYYLLAAPAFSAMHRLDATEVFHFYAGAPARMLLLHPDGSASEPVLGTDLAAGARPQVVVPAGTWQGTSTTGAWTLLGTTMAPGFAPERFELGHRAALAARWPAAAARIGELTRG
jgi:predicted cupin superfamily sugar epimerase